MTQNLEIRHCRALLAVRDTGGVGAAARALGVAQSTVSEMLLSLERVLGVPVTVRSPGRGATLTTAAEILLPYALALVSTSETALAAVAREGRDAIRLGAVESISSFLLPGPLAAFRGFWPQVNVRIAVGVCHELRARVERAELDVALTLESATRPGDDRTSEELSRPGLRFIAAPGHPLAEGVVTRRDLDLRTLLLADADGAFNTILEIWVGRARRSPKFESAGSIDGVKRGVLDSEAIGVLPDYAVARELGAGSLVALDIADALPPLSLRLTTREPPRAGSAVEALVGQIRQALVVLPGRPVARSSPQPGPLAQSPAIGPPLTEV